VFDGQRARPRVLKVYSGAWETTGGVDPNDVDSAKRDEGAKGILARVSRYGPV
jgi:hypothetical protein